MRLRDYISLDRLCVGDHLVLRSETAKDMTRIMIGDATLYHEPTIGDDDVGWSDKVLLDLWVFEVHTFTF